MNGLNGTRFDKREVVEYETKRNLECAERKKVDKRWKRRFWVKIER